MANQMDTANLGVFQKQSVFLELQPTVFAQRFHGASQEGIDTYQG